MAALSADISAQGFCLEVMRAPQQGAQVDGYVLFGDRELDWKGEVVWVEPSNPQASHWSRIGVRFSWVSPGLRALLTIEDRKARKKR